MPKAKETTANTKKNEAAQEIAIASEQVTEKEIEIAAETLVGDVRDALLSNFRVQKKPWEQMNESEQTSLVENYTNTAKDLVKKAVQQVASNGRTTIIAAVQQLTIKDTIKVQIVVKKNEETMLKLGNAQGAQIMLLTGDPAEYEGERAPAKITPDQSDFASRLAGGGETVKSKQVA